MASTPPRRYAPRLPAGERREQLLDAALDIALERGFHAVTIDGVAKAACVTRPVVYGLFVDRAAMLTALAERAEQRALAQLASVFPDVPDDDSDLDPDALIVDSIRTYLETVRDDPRNWTVILVPPDGVPAELQLRTNANRRILLGQLRQLSDWGLRARGGPPLDPDLFARAVFTLAEGAARLVLEDPDRWQVDPFVDFTRSALRGLRT